MALPTSAPMAPSCQRPPSSDASRRSPSHPHGRTSGSVQPRTATSRRPVAMPRAESSTVTIPASVKSEKVPSTSMSSSLQMLSPRFGKRYASIWHCAVCQGRKSWQPWFLETTLIRVGNDDYAKQNNSYGLTTLKNRHVAVDGNEVRFRFTGKSGKQWSLRVKDRRVAKIIRACQELPGQELLQYIDEEGNSQDVTSSDVNAYLKEITGKDITAKDFRTWAGTVLAAMALSEMASFDSAAQAKRNLRSAIEKVAARLGNTPTICRKCDIHPEVLSSYMDGNLLFEIKSEVEDELRNALAGLKPEEAAVLAMLRSPLAKEFARTPAEAKSTGSIGETAHAA
jgi:hypothetical protein